MGLKYGGGGGHLDNAMWDSAAGGSNSVLVRARGVRVIRGGEGESSYDPFTLVNPDIPSWDTSMG